MRKHGENPAPRGDNDGEGRRRPAMSRREALARLGMVVVVPPQLPSYIAPSLTLLRQTSGDGDREGGHRETGGRRSGRHHVRPSFCPPPRRRRKGKKPSFDCD